VDERFLTEQRQVLAWLWVFRNCWKILFYCLALSFEKKYLCCTQHSELCQQTGWYFNALLPANILVAASSQHNWFLNYQPSRFLHYSLVVWHNTNVFSPQASEGMKHIQKVGLIAHSSHGSHVVRYANVLWV
jgi:hypothetical protein